MSSIRCAGFFVVRSPLLSGESPLAIGPEDAETAARRYLSDPLTAAALESASPSLLGAMSSGASSDMTAAAFAVLRYVERMRSRATPFALMAGYSLGSIGDGPSAIELVARSDYRRLVRLDVDTVQRLVFASRGSDVARSGLGRWLAKRDALVLPDIVRVPQRTNDTTLTYLDVARSAAVDAVLDSTRAGPRTIAELVAVLHPPHSQRDAEAFVLQLVDHQLLVPEELPSVLADSELTTMRRMPELAAVVLAADGMRDTRLGDPLDTAPVLRAVAAVDPGAVRGALIFDLVKPTSAASMSSADAFEVEQLASLLMKLTDAPAEPRSIAALREAFGTRYEGREVRLVEALDEERGLPFPIAASVAPPRSPLLVRCAVRLFARGLCAPDRVARIEDEDLEGAPEPATPAAFALLGKFARTAGGELEIHAPALGIAPGTSPFARAAGLDPTLASRTREFLDRAYGDDRECAAELAYLLVGPTGRINQFPRLMPFEVTVCPTPAPPEDRAIDVSDLLVRVERGRLRLRSARSGCDVRLFPVGATNFQRPEAPAIVRFLAALSRSDLVGFKWTWGELGDAPFLPRVCRGSHVVSPMTWNIDAAAIERLRKASADAVHDELSALRRRLDLPRHVLYLGADEQELTVDLECGLSVAAWLDIARGAARVEEAFPVERSIVRGPEGAFVNEIVVPLRGGAIGREAIAPAPSAASAPRHGGAYASAIHRDVRMPGSDYLYCRIAGGRRDLLPLLIELHDDVIAPAIERGDAELWFYLPYADPTPHIRLRLKGKPEALLGRVWPELRTALEESVRLGRVLDVSLLSYERESHRYGGRLGMDLTEQVWHAASEDALDWHRDVDVLELDEKELVRALVGAFSALLASAGLPVAECQRAAAKAFEGFARTREPIVLRRLAAGLHREWRADPTLGANPALPAAALALGRVAAEIAGGRLDRDLVLELLPDYLHTQALRYTTVWHGVDNAEALAYVVIEKVYAGIVARQKRGM